MDNSTRFVNVTNNTNGLLVYKIDSLHVRREFLAGGHLKIKFEELQEGLLDNGIRAMFEGGYLAVNHQDAIDLELEEATEEKETAVDEPIYATERDMVKLFTEGKKAEIYLAMKNASAAKRDEIINVLVKNRISDSNIVKWCKELYNYDLISALAVTNTDE